jgi:hypothetical protein
MGLLAGELALAQGIGREKAEARVASIVQHRHELQDRQADTGGWLQKLAKKVVAPFKEGKAQVAADSR